MWRIPSRGQDGVLEKAYRSYFKIKNGRHHLERIEIKKERCLGPNFKDLKRHMKEWQKVRGKQENVGT